MMTAAEILLLDFDSEIANTRRTLERVPEDKPDYKPHERSMAMGKLAMHCATLPLFGAYIMEDDGMDMARPTREHIPLVFTTRAACLALLDESAAKCRAAIASSSDSDLQTTWPFRFGDQLISHNSRLLSFRQTCFNHLVHHTAQLGVYLRLNEVPVPALYGPSADEQWAAT